MSVRRATINELDALAPLFDSYRVYYEQRSDLEGARAFLKERMENGESTIFMAYDGDEAVGFVQLYPTFSSVSMKRSLILNDLFVSEKIRSKGFGEKLIQQAIEFAAETGAKGLLLETLPENAGAQKLYERIGFTKESNYYYYFTI